MNLKHYNKDFQNKAMTWWRTLSINQQKEYEKAHGIIYDMALRSEVAAIYDKLFS